MVSSLLTPPPPIKDCHRGDDGMFCIKYQINLAGTEIVIRSVILKSEIRGASESDLKQIVSENAKAEISNLLQNAVVTYTIEEK